MESIRSYGRGKVVSRQQHAADGSATTRAPWWLPTATASLLAALGLYLAGGAAKLWFIRWEELLAQTTLVTFAYWAAQRAAKRFRASSHPAAVLQSRWLTVPAGAFPTLLVVLLFRAVVIEPFTIPSESMEPTLLVGDQIVVDKFAYGLKIPVLDVTLVSTGKPKHGDVVVFRSPVDPKADWIKRVVGVPGDTVIYKNQRLYVNGTPERASQEASPTRRGERGMHVTTGAVDHMVTVDPDLRPDYSDRKGAFPMSENCDFTAAGIQCIVPAGHYFVLGDNRDHSEDSRRWGFLPARNLVGRASYIWNSKQPGDRAGRVR